MKQTCAILIFLLFLSSEVFAQAVAPSTSFDDREACEENKGVWREFGNGCVDECYPKFDKFVICTSAVTFGCDCGKGRCWNEKSCASVAQYKKVFDKKFEEEQKLQQESKNKRKAEADANAGKIVDDLIAKNGTRTSTSDVAGAVKNNYNEFYNKNVDPAVNNAITATESAITSANKNLSEAAKQNLPSIDLPSDIPPEAPPIIINSGKAEVPSLFLEQEKAKQSNQSQTTGNQAGQANSPANSAQTLPVIALP